MPNDSRQSTRDLFKLAGVALLLTAATSCGPSSGTSPPSGASTSTPAPAADQGPQALGMTVTTSAGDTYTVIAFQPVQSNQISTPTPLFAAAFSAADVKECAGTGHTLTTNPTDWTADFSGNEHPPGHDASLVATPGPPLPTSATVNSGQCVEGWVAFTGFADGIAHAVHLNGTNFRWTVP